jgi:hypothetical protein
MDCSLILNKRCKDQKLKILQTRCLVSKDISRRLHTWSILVNTNGLLDMVFLEFNLVESVGY